MAPTVVNYGLGVLRRLVRSDNTKLDGDTDMEEGEQADEVIESRYLGEVTAETVQQHVELVFALSRRQQELLDDIFRVYPKMEAQVQDSVETLLTPLIQSLGASSKLIEILRIFPPGADRLALRVVTILSADGASPVLVSLVKGLLAERELNPRFIIPIVGQLDKVGELLCQALTSRPKSSDRSRASFRSWVHPIRGTLFGRPLPRSYKK